MKKIEFLKERIKSMNYKNMFITINNVYNINHKNRIFILGDMLFCTYKYGSGYLDYYCFGMYDLNKKQRQTILTSVKNNQYVALLNQKDHWHIFDNKNEFNQKFEKYLKRKWLYLDDADPNKFKKWMENMDVIIAKLNSATGGHGIEKLYKSDFVDLDSMYDYLKVNKLVLLEEVIKQHKDLNKIYPYACNTLRVITILNNNKVHIVTMFIRIGNNNAFVDNTSSGGMLSMVNIETGEIMYPACDSNMNVYENHPMTNVKIKGRFIPCFNEVKQLVCELAKVVKEERYVAWDIAITDKGPLVIEGNIYPGYYYQFPIHTPNKTGAVPIFENILKVTNEKK